MFLVPQINLQPQTLPEYIMCNLYANRQDGMKPNVLYNSSTRVTSHVKYNSCFCQIQNASLRVLYLTKHSLSCFTYYLKFLKNRSILKMSCLANIKYENRGKTLHAVTTLLRLIVVTTLSFTLFSFDRLFHYHSCKPNGFFSVPFRRESSHGGTG